MNRSVLLMLLFLVVLMPDSSGWAADGFEESIVTLSTAKFAEGSGSVEDIRGALRIPKSGGKRPAVVIIHSLGRDLTGQAYAFALTQAGFVTLEPESWQTGRGREIPTPYLAHTFGALQYLAAHPRVDPTRIGGVGFSLGGILTSGLQVSISRESTRGESSDMPPT